MSAPDLTQKVLGYREFIAISEGDRLRSVTADYTWQPGPNHASCPCGIVPISVAQATPHPFCMCGLYAWHDCPPVASWWLGAGNGGIAAAVLAWGRMQVHRDGFRAEHAEIVLLGYRPDERECVERCATYYGVRAVPIDALHEEARLLGAPVPESLRPAPGTLARDYEAAMRRAQAKGAKAAKGAAVAWLVVAAVQVAGFFASHLIGLLGLASVYLLGAALFWRRYRRLSRSER